MHFLYRLKAGIFGQTVALRKIDWLGVLAPRHNCVSECVSTVKTTILAKIPVLNDVISKQEANWS